MRLVAERERFLAAFGLCAKLAPTKPTRPAYGYVLVDATPEGVKLKSTDGETTLHVGVPGVQVTEPGQVMLPRARVSSILDAHRDREVTIATADSRMVNVFLKNAGYSLVTMDTDEFVSPPTPAEHNYDYCVVDAGTLRSLVKLTAFAAGSDSARWATNGVLVEIVGGDNLPRTIRLVSTDGRRLACASAPCEYSAGLAAGSGVIPSRALPVLDYCLREVNNPDGDNRICLGISDGTAYLVANETKLWTRLVAGKFPDYTKIFPQKSNCRVSLDVEVFRQAILQVSAVADQVTSCAVRIRLAKDEIRLDAGTKGHGQSSTSIPTELAGQTIELAINPTYLLQALSVIQDHAKVYVDFIDALSPVVMTVDGDRFKYVVMPLNQPS